MQNDKLVFIIGAPRSGTTWLHLMLGAHSEIVTGQESQVFSNYLAPMYARWKMELDYPQSDGVRQHGIATYLDEDEFLDLLRNFAGKVFEKAKQEKPGATFFLEKSPTNTPHVELITKCFPQVCFIHMIRDGRDVATSMLMASRGWGKSWFPRRVETAAQEWKGSVVQGRKAKGLTRRYTEIRYEELLSRGSDELKRLLDFVGVSSSEEEVNRIYDEFKFAKLSRGDYSREVFKNPGTVTASGTRDRKEPAGFFRKGVAGDWVNHLKRNDIKIFNWIAGDLLVDLGYATPEEVRAPRFIPLGLLARNCLKSSIRTLGSLMRTLGLHE